MDIQPYDLKDLILVAMKSETESREVYQRVAHQVKNFFLKERLLFMAGEEEKHRDFFEKLFSERFPGQAVCLPQKSPVPLPSLVIEDERVPLSQVFEKAMAAEMGAFHFYQSLAQRFGDALEIQKMILYIASMEIGHYQLLDIEKKNLLQFEDMDLTWPMQHVGP